MLSLKKKWVNLAILVISVYIIWTVYEHFNMGNRNRVESQGAIKYTDMESNAQVCIRIRVFILIYHRSGL